MNKMIVVYFLSTLLSSVQAAEMDHSKMDHGQMDHEKMNHGKIESVPVASSKTSAPAALAILAEMPASGRAREGGSDGRYVMESISVSDSVAERCAKASRGLMMLDNATWAQCGGKPKGAAMTPAAMLSKKESDEHAGHQMP